MDEDIWIKISKILTIAGFICQQVQHELRLVIREMNAGAQFHEYDAHVIRNPELVRMALVHALELVDPWRQRAAISCPDRACKAGTHQRIEKRGKAEMKIALKKRTN